MMVMVSHYVGDIVPDLAFEVCWYCHLLLFVIYREISFFVYALDVERSVVHLVILVDNLVSFWQIFLLFELLFRSRE